MPLITAIELQKNKKYANIFVDNKFCFSLELSQIKVHKLKQGKDLTETEIEDLSQKSLLDKMTSACLSYLSYRPRSEKEILIYLDRKLGKRYEDKIKKLIKLKLIDKLKQDNLIDDEKFANWWIEQRTRFKPKSNYLISRELLFKGIDKQTINKLLSERNELQTAELAFAEKKFKNLNNLQERQRCINFLRRRGFSWEIIKQIVDDYKAKQ